MNVYRTEIGELNEHWDYVITVEHNGKIRSDMVSGGEAVIDRIVSRLVRECEEE